MLLFQTPAVLLSLFGLIAVHGFAVFLPDRIGKYFGYANLLLHIACLFLLLFYHFAIDEAVLFYMISVFCYTAFSAFGYFVLPKLSKRAEPEEPAVQGSEEENK